MLKTLTWADFLKPCYDPQERYGDFSGTILDILQDSRIPDTDKIWAFTREGIVDDRTLRLFACRCVREVWHLLTDERSRNAVEVAERYANGQATDEELRVAKAAASNVEFTSEPKLTAAWAAWAAAMESALTARAAARAAREAARAAREAAWAARGAAWSAACEAAWAAACEAAWTAREAAAREAAAREARGAACAKQVQIAIELIEEQTS